MVSLNVEQATFHKVAEVSDGQVDCKELSVKCAISSLGWFELSGKYEMGCH